MFAYSTTTSRGTPRLTVTSATTILAGETEEVAASGRHWALESIEEDLTVDENARSAALGQRDLEPPVFFRDH